MRLLTACMLRGEDASHGPGITESYWTEMQVVLHAN
jgi:hypothetical protein